MSTTFSVSATAAVAWDHPRLGRIREVVCGRHESELLAALGTLGIGCSGEASLRTCLRCAHAGSRAATWLGSVATPTGEGGERVHGLLRDVRRLTEERDEALAQRDALKPGEGRVVVELPEPVGRYGWDWSSPAGRVEAYNHQGVPRVAVGHAGDWSADDAERVFLAGLAACRTARQLSTNDRAARSSQGSEVAR